MNDHTIKYQGGGVAVQNFQVFCPLKIVILSANNVDRDEMTHTAAFHLCPHCFSECLLTPFMNIHVKLHPQ